MSPTKISHSIPDGPEQIRQHFGILRERQRSLQSRETRPSSSTRSLPPFYS